ncbi:MAG: hypothetical protein H6811_04715 [Phycisphaeraceae bacterium]|nr:hypothetical protein [Phycisphaeraceae bacterium]
MTVPSAGPATPEPAVQSPELTPVDLHLVTPAAPFGATVVASESCTATRRAASFVRHVVLDVSGSPLAGRVRPGQSFGVLPPGLDGNGRPHKLRLYSAASPSLGEDGHGNHLSTTVKRTIDEHWETHRLFLGVASNFLCDLQVGDRVPVTGPNGKRFVLPSDPAAHDYVFFATGTGIAPFRGMVLDLLRSGVDSRIVLVMGAAYATDLLYDSAFLELADSHPNFTYLTALSRQSQRDGHAPMYVSRRLETHRDLFRSVLASDRALIYVCGVAGMELGLLRELVTVLPPSESTQYVEVDPDLRNAPQSWERRMIHKQIRPSRRVFLEVYA